MSSKKVVLVTGASGFIGRHTLAPLIARGFEVHATYRGTLTEVADVIWHHADLLDQTSITEICATTRPTHLLHLAWYVSHKDYKTSPENEHWIGATMMLLEAFVKNDGKRAVLAGTAMEYDRSIAPEFIQETSPLNPSTPYGKAKVETLRLASAFAHSHDLSLAWARIFLMYGPHEARSRLVPYVINSILDKRIAECTSGEQVRDILYVKDVADAFAALLDSDVQGAVNIGSGEPAALKDVILRIADIMGKRELVLLGAKKGAEEPPRLVFDVRRLRKEVGWEPRYSLEEALRETIAWWRENNSTRSLQ